MGDDIKMESDGDAVFAKNRGPKFALLVPLVVIAFISLLITVIVSPEENDTP